MGRVARSERTKSQLRAEARGIRRAKRVMARPAPRPTPGRYVVAPGYKPVNRKGKIVIKRVKRPKRKRSSVFSRRLVARGPQRYASLSRQPRVRLSQNKLSFVRDRYTPGTIQYRQAQRFSRSPMGRLSAQLRKEEKRQSKLYGVPVKLQLNRRTGKVKRYVGAPAVRAANQRQFATYQRKAAARRDAKSGKGEVDRVIAGAAKETGQILGYVTARGKSLNPIEALTRIGAGEAAKKTVGKEKAKKLEASGIPGLSDNLSKKIKVSEPVNLLKLMDQTQRPSLAVTGGLKQIVENVQKGKPVTQGVGREAKKGLTLKERDYGSDVLKAAGVGGAAAFGAGLAIDVLADPLTYLTFGAGSAGRVAAMKTAQKAAAKTEKKTFKQLVDKGMDEEAARESAKKAGSRKFKQVYDEASKDERLAVTVGTKRRKAVVKLPIKAKSNVKGKSAANAFRPTVARTGDDAAVNLDALNARRNVRAVVSQGLARAQITADWLARKVKTKDYGTLIDALENPRLKSKLPDYLVKPSVKMEVRSPEFRKAWDKAYNSGKSVDEANLIARKATAGQKKQYRKVSIYDVLRADFRQSEKMRRRAGQGQGSVRDYFPHMVDEMLRSGRRTPLEVMRGVAKRRGPDVEEATLAADELRGKLMGPSAKRAGSTKRREMKMPISEANPILREKGKPQFSVDLPLVKANYETQDANIMAQGVAASEIAGLGREVRIKTVSKPKTKLKGDKVVESGRSVRRAANVGSVADNEGIYVYKQSRPKTDGGTEVPGRLEWSKATDAEAKALRGGVVPRDVRQVRVIQRSAVEETMSGLDQFSSIPRDLKHLEKADDLNNWQKIQKPVYWAVDRILDPPMRVWKNIATRTPQFHLRNMVGDVSMAYNVVPGPRMPQLMKEALQVTWYLRGARKNPFGFSERDKFMRIGYRDKTLRRSEGMHIGDFGDELIENGVILGGVLGSDLDSLSKYGARGISRKNHSAAYVGRGIDRALQDRENFMRIVVYKHFRDEGLAPKMAARKTADAMIDYSELSVYEKEIFKRAAPFYTFAARSIPIYALTFVKRPGKLANIEKTRQEVARASGTDAETLKDEQTYRQRGYAFPIRINGTQYMPSFGLPLMALNQLPAGFSLEDLQKTIKENYRFVGGSLAPTIGIPIESWRNYSFFYDSKLENDPPRDQKVPTVLPGLFDAFAAQFGGKTTARGKDSRQRTFLKIGPVLDRRTGKMVTGIGGIPANAISKSLPGGPGLVLNLSRDTNRRGQDEKRMLFSFFSGIKADTADPRAGQKERLFKELTSIDKEIASIPGKSGRDAKDKKSLNKQKYQIMQALYQLDKKSGSKVPIFGPPGRKKKKGWADGSTSSSGGWATRKSSSKGWAE